jgi:hypothetical protein
MSAIPMLAAGLVLGGGAPASLAQPKPDVLVTLGSVIREPTVVRVPVLIGNQAPVPPAANVDYVVALAVLTATSQVVCESQVQVATVAPNSTRTAFHFVLTYTAPGALQPGPGLGHRVKTMQYRLIARATPTQPCPTVDANCGNNTLIRDFQFPVGGAPACIRLL